MQPPAQLQEIQGLSQDTSLAEYVGMATGGDQIHELRMNSIIEAGRTMGTQAGVRWRYERINDQLERLSNSLDFMAFNQLLMNDGLVAPPIVDAVEGSFKIEEDGSANQSQMTYRIYKDAQIVSQPPSWRSYLIKHFDAAETVNKAVLPKTSDEKAAWKRAVGEGWNSGIRHAERLFEINLNRLTRDYLGMVRFHDLLDKGIVSMPMMATGDLGITVRGKKLDIGQKTFRITQDARFANATQWKAQGSYSHGIPE